MTMDEGELYVDGKKWTSGKRNTFLITAAEKLASWSVFRSD